MSDQELTKPVSDDGSQNGRALLLLREMILRGDFQRGERLSELPLVSRLGVSRTPIRLALERLAHEGLLEISPNGGFTVREFTLSDVWDAIEVRGVLEGTAARLAAERLGGIGELKKLCKYRDEMDAITVTVDSFGRYLELNDAFHSEMVRLAKSEMLNWTLDRVVSLPFASPSAVVFARSRHSRAVEMHTIGNEQHHALVEAIMNRQGSRAEALAREHARLSRRNLEMALSDDKAVLSHVPGGALIKN